VSQIVSEAKGIQSKEIEDIIAKAIQKAGVKNEIELSRFIPASSGGYIHHFTLRKMKKKQPQELKDMIEKFIMTAKTLQKLAPKTRAARGSRKRRDQINFNPTQIERMLQIAKQAGDQELIAALSLKKPLAACKRDLIASIRHKRVEQALWNAYVEAANAQQASEIRTS
jgi:hypothetical protein